jgi:patatin-related protein
VTPQGNDLSNVNTPFLAFASRCTSSFPFAFEPMTLSAVTRMKIDDGTPGVLRWNDFFPNLPRAEVQQGLHVHRAFGDGGYLDNKPFSYVADTLSRRFSAVPIERKLLFVEPSPDKLDPHEMPEDGNAPDALENSLAALTTIPRYESIREDLQAVLSRNRRIERIERVVRLGELSVNPTDAFSVRISGDGKIPTWSKLKLSEMIAYYGTAFLPYQRLRVYAVTDRLADRLGRQWDIVSDSDQQYALRALVRVWRERNFSDEGGDKPTINAFLDEFDVEYRVRRLAFLLRKTDQLIRLFHRRTLGSFDMRDPEPGAPRPLSEEETQLLGALPPMFLRLSADVQVSTVAHAEKVLLCIKCGLLRSYDLLLTASRRLDGTGPTEAIDEKMRRELDAILLLVLGQTPEGQSPEVTSFGAAGTVHVHLNAEALRMASATRTLQEAVAFRAAALFDSAESVAATPLQVMLVRGIEAMRVKSEERAVYQVEKALHVAAGLGWHVLGRPELTISPGGSRVDVTVHDVAPSESFADNDACLEQLNSEIGQALRTFLSHYYLRFDTYDQMSFPLYYDTATGEPSIVEVVRVSPVDAKNLIDEESDVLHRRKLAGTALANFGAFLDHRWRLNDIMWGRLDGAERLIQALLPMRDKVTSTVRKELIERAQRSILRESLVPNGNATLLKLMMDALAGVPGEGDTSEKLKKLLETSARGTSAEREQLRSVLTSLLSEPGLMHYVRTDRKLDPEPDPEATMKSASRAVTIIGKLLEGISERRRVGKAVPRWLARLGLMLQGIVAVSLPGTLNQRWWTHGVKLLYAFEALLIVFALFLGSSDMRSLALTGFAATLGIHLVTLIAGDVVREQGTWIRTLVAVLLIALVLLAGLGGVVFFHQATQQAMCWTNATSVESHSLAARICDRVHQLQVRWNRTTIAR